MTWSLASLDSLRTLRRVTDRLIRHRAADDGLAARRHRRSRRGWRCRPAAAPRSAGRRGARRRRRSSGGRPPRGRDPDVSPWRAGRPRWRGAPRRRDRARRRTAGRVGAFAAWTSSWASSSLVAADESGALARWTTLPRVAAGRPTARSAARDRAPWARRTRRATSAVVSGRNLAGRATVGTAGGGAAGLAVWRPRPGVALLAAARRTRPPSSTDGGSAPGVRAGVGFVAAPSTSTKRSCIRIVAGSVPAAGVGSDEGRVVSATLVARGSAAAGTLRASRSAFGAAAGDATVRVCTISADRRTDRRAMGTTSARTAGRTSMTVVSRERRAIVPTDAGTPPRRATDVRATSGAATRADGPPVLGPTGSPDTAACQPGVGAGTGPPTGATPGRGGWNGAAAAGCSATAGRATEPGTACPATIGGPTAADAVMAPGDDVSPPGSADRWTFASGDVNGGCADGAGDGAPDTVEGAPGPRAGELSTPAPPRRGPPPVGPTRVVSPQRGVGRPRAARPHPTPATVGSRSRSPNRLGAGRQRATVGSSVWTRLHREADRPPPPGIADRWTAASGVPALEAGAAARAVAAVAVAPGESAACAPAGTALTGGVAGVEPAACAPAGAGVAGDTEAVGLAVCTAGRTVIPCAAAAGAAVAGVPASASRGAPPDGATGRVPTATSPTDESSADDDEAASAAANVLRAASGRTAARCPIGSASAAAAVAAGDRRVGGHPGRRRVDVSGSGPSCRALTVVSTLTARQVLAHRPGDRTGRATAYRGRPGGGARASAPTASAPVRAADPPGQHRQRRTGPILRWPARSSGRRPRQPHHQPTRPDVLRPAQS